MCTALASDQRLKRTDVLKALTKAKMADQLFDELGLNKREAKEIVELFFDEIRDSLERNVQVKLSGFGNFDLREKGERPGRNPKTGEEIPITARRVVTFRPGQKLKARVEAYAGEQEAEQEAGQESAGQEGAGQTVEQQASQADGLKDGLNESTSNETTATQSTDRSGFEE